MSNPITTVGHDIKTVAVDVAHVAVDVVEFLPKAASVIASAIKDEPTVRTAVLDLVKNASAVLASGTVAVTDKGVNLVADASVLAAAEAFFGYFKTTFVPLVEQLYGEVVADVKS
jgi:hypothetical protein